jgi:hypothetical protein
MPACAAPFLPAAALPSRACARAHLRLRSAAACKSDRSQRLLPVAVALMVMMATSAAFGVARAQGTLSTAQLSVARGYFAAASVGNMALFAGGLTASALMSSVGRGGDNCCVCVECLRVYAAVFLFCLPCERPRPLSCAPPQVLVVLLLMLWTCTIVQPGRGRRLS